MTTTDRLFRSIEVKEEEHHAPNCISSWGRVLDAGTGDHSLKWLKSLPTEAIVAVTGDTNRAVSLRKKFPEPHMNILAGNWNDPSFLEGQVFDVVIADYLVGAIEGHAPYYQDQIFHRLFRHVADGGRLYIVGLQPITMSLDPSKPKSAQEELVLEMQRVRDACILLAGHRTYREFPVDWILRQTAQAGFQVQSHTTFPNKYSASMIKRQVAVGRNKLPLILDQGVADSLEKYLATLDKQAEDVTNDGSFEFGYDYVVSAVKPA
ncbi:hypothetical protein DYB37_003514 [Aphanomyces astaci]|uniref:Methyltransferase type 11 domain-containing protein n=1 Tax=Aphanomyces astaci TaxID=112090 RepID=A0A3R6Y5U4_APHAT|nr:hypothetical protein DYB35_003816 [Aphanomyces astaci]RHZ33992.1 hypothetical protein DYB37_003514 [Aphanomyces astaci]